jgi:hypothetical protein
MEAMADQYFRLYSLDVQIDTMLTSDDFYFDKKVTKQSLRSVQDEIKRESRTLRLTLQACSESMRLPRGHRQR